MRPARIRFLEGGDRLDRETARRRIKAGLAGLAGLLPLALGVGLLAYPRQVQESVRESLFSCLTALVPSLFPFLALTGLAVHFSPGGSGGPLGGLCRYLFRLPGRCALPVLLGMAGGYPAGVKGASSLWERGEMTKEQAGRMALFCVNPGPAFVVTYVGGGVFGSFRLGWLLCLSGVLASLILGAISGLGRPVPPKEAAPPSLPHAQEVTRSVADASRATLTLCAWVVLFAGGISLLRETGALRLISQALSALGPLSPGDASAALACLLEVTSGMAAVADLGASPALAAFGLGFGGLCVHTQLFSFFREFPVSRRRFFLFRLLHGLLAALLFQGAVRLFPQAAETAALLSSPAGVATLSGTWAGGLSLLLMCAAFLLIAPKQWDR